MNEPRILADIRNQPASLARVLDYQLGEGRPALAAAAESIRGARRVVLTGMGGSLFACVPLQYFLVSRGFACEVVEGAELLHYLHPAAKDAAVVVVSRSGESAEITRALERVGSEAARSIGVTNERESRLAGEAACPVFVNSLADEMVAIQTYTGTLLTLLLMGFLAAGEPEREWRGAVDAALGALSGIIARHEAESACWNGFLDGMASVHLLARGPSRGSALEGALLFNEVARTASTAMGAGEFRHGPVEIAGEGFRSIVFAPEGATRHLNLALASDLRSFGAQVRVVGPEDGEGGVSFWSVPALPDAVAPLAEIVPVQFAALRLAELRGLQPGRFRYVRQVTVSEIGFERPPS